MMSPITAAPGITLSSDCTSDSDEVLPRPSSRYRPKTQQQQRAPGLVKSISESAIGTPKMKTILAKKRANNVLTPRGNERKKQRSKVSKTTLSLSTIKMFVLKGKHNQRRQAKSDTRTPAKNKGTNGFWSRTCRQLNA